MRQVKWVGWLIAVVLVLGATGMLSAAGSADKVKVAVSADKPAGDGKQVIAISLDIDPAWHLYANPVGNDMLATAATKVTVTGKNKLEDVVIEYPKGKVVKDKDLGDYSTYEGKVLIKAVVKRSAGDGPLKVTVKFQACDAKICLPPSAVDKTVD